MAHIARPILLALLLLPFSAAFAQATGKLRLIIDPANGTEYVLDRKFRMQQRELELLPGPHHFSFWAPTRKLVDTTLVVTPATVTDFRLRLPFATDYLRYSKEMERWKQRRTLQRTVPLLATVGGAAWTVLQMRAVTNADNRLKADREAYERAVLTDEIRRLKEETIPEHNKQAQRARTLRGVAGGFTVAALAGTIYMYIRTAREEAPRYEDKEKIRFDGLVWVPGPAGGSLQGALTIPLAR